MRKTVAVALFGSLAVLAGALAAGCAVRQPRQPLPPVTLPPEPQERATRFVMELMEARAAGDEAAARLYLSPTASEQFAAGAGGLTLTGGDGFADWALLALEAADASSFEVRVRVEDAAGEAWEELLFVGVGPGPDGASRDLTVRGAERRPAPSPP